MPDYSVDVIDLGLHLEEGLSLGLDTEEFTRKKALPDGLVLTETEREYFEGEEVWRNESNTKRSWVCERIELNAFTAPELIAYVERQLQQAEVRGKVIPIDEVITNQARLVYEQEVDSLVNQVVQEIIPIDQIKRAIAAQFRERIPWQDTREWVVTSLDETPTHAWRHALELKVRDAVEHLTDEAEASIRARLHTGLAAAAVLKPTVSPIALP
jgi:hypothetical protein